MLAARLAIGAAVLALVALATVHVFRRDLDPSRTMISRYALGAHGWIMGVCFAAFGAGSASLFAALLPVASSVLSRVGLTCLMVAGIGFGLAAVFPMDAVGTPRGQLSRSAKMHSIAFAVGMPGFVLAALLLSLVLAGQPSHSHLPVLPVTAAIWLGLIIMIATGVMVGPDHGPNPHIPRLFGWANRLLVIAYGVWLVVAAWPLAR